MKNLPRISGGVFFLGFILACSDNTLYKDDSYTLLIAGIFLILIGILGFIVSMIYQVSENSQSIGAPRIIIFFLILLGLSLYFIFG